MSKVIPDFNLGEDANLALFIVIIIASVGVLGGVAWLALTGCKPCVGVQQADEEQRNMDQRQRDQAAGRRGPARPAQVLPARQAGVQRDGQLAVESDQTGNGTIDQSVPVAGGSVVSNIDDRTHTHHTGVSFDTPPFLARGSAQDGAMRTGGSAHSQHSAHGGPAHSPRDARGGTIHTGGSVHSLPVAGGSADSAGPFHGQEGVLLAGVDPNELHGPGHNPLDQAAIIPTRATGPAAGGHLRQAAQRPGLRVLDGLPPSVANESGLSEAVGADNGAAQGVPRRARRRSDMFAAVMLDQPDSVAADEGEGSASESGYTSSDSARTSTQSL